MLSYIAPGFYVLYMTMNRKGIKQLITQCMNNIYGTMEGSLLYYSKFCKMLKTDYSRINPYDPCVANQMVNGLQQLIISHVDGCRLSHKYPKLN